MKGAGAPVCNNATNHIINISEMGYLKYVCNNATNHIINISEMGYLKYFHLIFQFFLFRGIINKYIRYLASNSI